MPTTIPPTTEPLTTAPPPLGANLLENPGAEEGGSPPVGWTGTSGIGVAAITLGTNGSTPFEGTNVFWAGNNDTATITQTVDLLAEGFSSGDLDSGTLTVNVGGYQRSAAQPTNDEGQITVEYLDASSVVLKTFKGPRLENETGWQLTEETRVLPAGCRKIKFTFDAFRNSGTSNDGWLDAAFVIVDEGTVSVLDTNLLVNPGAETFDITGWTSSTYFSTGGGSAGTNTGRRRFQPGAVAGAQSLEQTIDLQDIEVNGGSVDADILAAGLIAEVGGFQASFASNNDPGEITVEFLDAGSTLINVFRGPTLVPLPVGTWVLTSAVRFVPSNTRFIKFKHTATRSLGSNTDAYLDDCFVKLSVVPTTVPTDTNLLVNPGAEDASSNEDPVLHNDGGTGPGGWKSDPPAGQGGTNNDNAGFFASTSSPRNGSFKFFPPPKSSSSLTQELDLRALGFSEALLDSGIAINSGGYIDSFSGDADSGQIVVQFLDDLDGVPLETFTGSVLSPDSGWVLDDDERFLPTGTRFIRYKSSGRQGRRQTPTWTMHSSPWVPRPRRYLLQQPDRSSFRWARTS